MFSFRKKSKFPDLFPPFFFKSGRLLAAISLITILAVCSSGCVSSLVNTAYAAKGNITGSSKTKKLPEVFNEKSDKFDDPELSLQKIKSELSKYCTVYKLVVYGKGPDWEVRKDDFGNIERKITKREIYFTYKYNKDGKFYYNDCYFEKQYEGGGNYGAKKVVFMTPTEIDENLATK